MKLDQMKLEECASPGEFALQASTSTTWFVLAILVVACGTTADREPMLIERIDSADVEVFRVHRTPRDTVRFDAPVVRIGSDDIDATEHETFALITDVILLDGGRVGIIDNGAARVAVFDSLGNWLYDVGSKGEGPGEHTGPIHASVRRDTLLVWDALQARLSRYLDDGSFVDSTPLGTWKVASPFGALVDGYIREIEWGQGADPAPAQGAIVRMSRDGVVDDTLAGPYAVPDIGLKVDDETGMVTMVNPPALEISPPWLATESSLLQLDPIAATVAFHDLQTGTTTRLLQLPYRVRSTSEDDREAFIQGLSAELGIPPESLAADRRFSDLRPPVAGLHIDDMDRIWVAPHDPGARGRRYVGSDWDVYDLDRASALRVQFPANFYLKALREGKAYGVTTTDYGVQIVDVMDLASL